MKFCEKKKSISLITHEQISFKRSQTLFSIVTFLFNETFFIDNVDHASCFDHALSVDHAYLLFTDNIKRFCLRPFRDFQHFFLNIDHSHYLLTTPFSRIYFYLSQNLQTLPLKLKNYKISLFRHDLICC